MNPETIMIDKQKYVRSDCIQEKAQKIDGMERCIVRSYAAGVFVGYVKEQKAELNGINVVLLKAKRIHYWSGACSLTQLAIDGTNDSDNCRITDAVDEQKIANVIEIIPITEKANVSINGVKIWKK
jgi:hypothetical protein